MNRREVHGILILDKPKGITSNLALQKVKRLFQARKAGHTGSLDPIATGLLPICFGKATKCAEGLLGSDKHYRVTALLGVKTTTGDSEGSIIEEKAVSFTEAELEEVLGRFRGELQQVPPMYSALKHHGQPLYKLARQGITIPRNSRDITIYELKLIKHQDNYLTLEARVSKGTYIRTLVEDLGEALGCGAHVIELRRLGAGPYSEAQMYTFEMLESESVKGLEFIDPLLLSVDTALGASTSNSGSGSLIKDDKVH